MLAKELPRPPRIYGASLMFKDNYALDGLHGQHDADHLGQLRIWIKMGTSYKNACKWTDRISMYTNSQNSYDTQEPQSRKAVEILI